MHGRGDARPILRVPRGTQAPYPTGGVNVPAAIAKIPPSNPAKVARRGPSAKEMYKKGVEYGRGGVERYRKLDANRRASGEGLALSVLVGWLIGYWMKKKGGVIPTIGASKVTQLDALTAVVVLATIWAAKNKPRVAARLQGPASALLAIAAFTRSRT